jgi:hypothetical protein
LRFRAACIDGRFGDGLVERAASDMVDIAAELFGEGIRR